MTKSTLIVATLLIALGTAVVLAQTGIAPGDRNSRRAPSQEESVLVDTSDEASAEANADQTQPAPPEVQPGEALKRTPVFVAEGQSEQNARILSALGAPLSNAGFNFTETPLSEIVNFIRDEYEIEVQLDTRALDDLGLSPDDTITANIRRVSLATALKLMLTQHDLTYIISDEILLITSEDEALVRLTVQVYPVGDLLQPREGRPQATAATMDDLIDLLISNVANDTWAENGGGEAEMRPLQPGMLIVSQTQAVHEEIANLLMALRHARQHELAIPYAPPAKKAKKSPGGGGFGGGRASGGESSEEKSEKD